MQYPREYQIVADFCGVTVTLVGCGSLGSFIALALTKFCPKEIILVDKDTVEKANLPNQVFRKEDTGKSKVEALKEILEEFAPYDLKIETFHNDIVNIENLNTHILIICVDSLEIRKMIWKKVKSGNFKNELFVDCRFGIEEKEKEKEFLGIIHIFAGFSDDPDFEEIYEKFLEGEGLPMTCGASQFVGIPLILAGFLISLLNIYLKEKEEFPSVGFYQIKVPLTKFGKPEIKEVLKKI